jgi:hypothetical protein
MGAQSNAFRSRFGILTPHDVQVAALHRALVHVVQLACEVEADYRQFPADWLFHFR